MKNIKKNKKQIKIIVFVVIILLAIWFLFISPLLKFKKNEKIVKDAALKFYEINNRQLPTGHKVKTLSLITLYEKKFIESDLRGGYTNKVCDMKSSWVKVKQEDGEYKYYVYLKCGLFSSNIDHKGPEIKLNGKEEVTINKGEKYKDPGINSVIDNTDGKIDINKVEIDNKVNTNKIGTYKITYKIKDSFNNETEKIRVVNVIETLNHIVEKDTNGTKIYKGIQESNYVKLDGITFKIIGENEDGSIKLFSDYSLSVANYDSVDKWLNDYFYNQFSDSAKNLIQKSKWCNEEVSNPDGYSKCNSYGKKSNIGLLSVADINNSKDKDGNYNTDTIYNSLLSNKKSSKSSWMLSTTGYTNINTNQNTNISPALNIVKDIKVIGGTGTNVNPYILNGNKKKLKVGSDISNARVGEYINYSGYNWRVIGKENDGTTKIIMVGVTTSNGNNYYVKFGETSKIQFNPNNKNNIGNYIVNNAVDYVKTGAFEKKKIEVDDYKTTIGYQENSNKNSYNMKLTIPSMYDLFSYSGNQDYWFRDYSSSKKIFCYTYYSKVTCSDYNIDTVKALKLEGYLKKTVKIKTGNGSLDSPYVIVN